MKSKKTEMTPTLAKARPQETLKIPASGSHSRIIATTDESRCLDTVQLTRLEQSFRQWAEGALRSDVRLSRQRILLIFLLIRYTGAKLNEVLALDPFQDIDHQRQWVVFGKAEGPRDGNLG